MKCTPVSASAADKLADDLAADELCLHHGQVKHMVALPQGKSMCYTQETQLLIAAVSIQLTNGTALGYMEPWMSCPAYLIGSLISAICLLLLACRASRKSS